MKTWHGFGLFLITLLLFGCSWISPSPVPTPDKIEPTPIPPTPTVVIVETEIKKDVQLVISELLPGIKGNNNYEFIELYNASVKHVDLYQWSLWFRMADNQDEKPVYMWSKHTDIPGYGYFLLVREGQDFNIIADAEYTTPLFERRGGLVLRDADGNAVDILGWGEAPQGYYEGSPAQNPDGMGSLERKPGGGDGHGADTDDNAADFILLAQPNPQSRASEITPLPEKRLDISLESVAAIEPGTEFEVEIHISNPTHKDIDNIEITLPLPSGLEVVDLDARAENAKVNDVQTLSWSLKSLQAGMAFTWVHTLRSPWSYDNVTFSGLYADSPSLPLRRYAKTVPLLVQGGAIPIDKARTLTGQVVTIEGVATMYTGGYYAGSTGTKFYIDDGTGGIQVFCPGGMGIVYVDIGDRVRVTGLIEVYRDSLEIIPEVYPDHVEILSSASESIPIISSSVESANTDEALLGRLITVQGQVTRFEEFTYSYELDIMDEAGQTVLVYLDKESHINPDFIEVGNLYKVSGILELYNTFWQLKPRLSSDFIEVFPEELMAEISAANSIDPGSTVTYTITAFNHTQSILHNITIAANIPPAPAALSEILDNGEINDSTILWQVPAIDPDGGRVSVHFSIAAGENGIIEMEPALVSAEDYPDQVVSNPWKTFVGSGVPIWAIQGDGFNSPFVRSIASTEGVVTGIFQELQGFWIQSLDPDDNALTSEGLYVFTNEGDLPISPGDYVQVTGKISEKSGQTQLSLSELSDLIIHESSLPLPEAQELNPPLESDLSKQYYEALEGMLVQVSGQARAIAPVSKYGEYVLVKDGWGIERVMLGEPQGMMIFIDDGSAVTHYDQSTLLYVVKTGDFVENVMGPLAFTYDNYKVQPITMPTVIENVVTLPSLPELDEGEFSIATFNVENFFDIYDPHPSDPPRPSIGEYRQKINKTAATIISMGVPTIIGFQEVENVMVLDDLAQHESLAEYSYVPILMEGLDSRGIDVGYLVRTDRATVVNATPHPAPEGLTSRPPLVIEVALLNDPSESVVYVINNHFTSMAAGELATEPQRNLQAAWNVSLVDTILASEPDAYVAVVGDLNSFYDSPPLDTLRSGGLRHAYEFIAPDLPYTYIYQGVSETLDHILLTPSLYQSIQRVDVLHTNADYPPLDPDDASARGVSDHDPFVVVFSFD